MMTKTERQLVQQGYRYVCSRGDKEAAIALAAGMRAEGRKARVLPLTTPGRVYSEREYAIYATVA